MSEKIDKQDKSFTNQNNSCLEFTYKNSVIKKLLNKFNDVFSKKSCFFSKHSTDFSFHITC